MDPDAPRECLPDLPLVADLTDCESVLSRLVVELSPLRLLVLARGLSADDLPGILVRKAVRNERDDSFVSDLLKDGYEPSSGPEPVGV